MQNKNKSQNLLPPLTILIIVVVGLILVTNGCANLPIGESGGKNILMVIAPNNFREDTTIEPKRLLEEKGFKIILASITLDEATGVGGSKLKPEITISEAKAENYDAIILAGGRGVKEHLWGNNDLISLIKEAYKSDKVIAGICFSPVVIAQAGILKDKEATVLGDLDSIDQLKKNGAIYVNEELVVSGKVVTARDPYAAEKFVLTIYQMLSNTAK